MTISEAKEKLKEMKLGIKYENINEDDVSEKIITNQIPKDGIKVYENTNIIVEY